MDIASLVEKELICLDLQAKSKEEVIGELVDMLMSAGKLNNKEQFLDDVWAREEIGNTGFERGIAIPHAKSASVTSPAMAVGISRTGIYYGTDVGELCEVFFVIASPMDGDRLHIDTLANVSTKIVEQAFIVKLKEAKSIEEAYQLLTKFPMEEGGALPQKQIQLGLSFTCLRYMSWLKGHLLFGTSHMIPFIVAGGVLLAISIALSGKGDVPSQGLLADIAKMGMAGLALFATILGGYIAFSIADKPSLAPAMIGTWIAVTQYNTGFLGAIVVGFLAGFIVRILKKISLPQNMVSLGAIFIYPLLGTFLTCGAVMWVIGDPISNAMGMLNQFLEELAGSGKFILGAALGSMTAFDMGGPINKVATLFAQTQVSTQPWLMGGVGIAICTPPLGMALATILAPSRFKADEREAGKAAWIMGMIGISEGAIPFAASDPGRVLPAIVMGGVVGNITGFAFEVINHAPWGGWIVLPVVEGKIGYIVGIVVGSFVTASIVILLKRKLVQESDVSEQVDYPDSLAVEGQAELVAVTACPSGVAHTYLAAQSLEKAAKKHGVRIKIETQGANGTSNCLTDNDIQNARLVILAHDVAINNSRRFDDLRVIDVGTREAIYNADMLVKSL